MVMATSARRASERTRIVSSLTGIFLRGADKVLFCDLVRVRVSFFLVCHFLSGYFVCVLVGIAPIHLLIVLL